MVQQEQKTDGFVRVRGQQYSRKVLCADGKGNATQIGQMYKVFYVEPMTVEEAKTLAESTLGDDSPQMLPKRTADLVQFAVNPDPYAKPPHYLGRVWDTYGHIRTMDALLDLYHDTDPGLVRKAAAKVESDVAKAMQEHHRLSVETRLEQFTGQDWVQIAAKEALEYESTILALQELVDARRDKILQAAKKEVDPTTTWHGNELMVLWTDPDHKAAERDARVVYEEEYPVEFKFTRADCGEHVVNGLVEFVDDQYRCTLTQAQDEGDPIVIQSGPVEPYNVPQTNCVIRAIEKLVEQHGGDPKMVSYNVKKTLFRFRKA